jgi:hypothetical protein
MRVCFNAFTSHFYVKLFKLNALFGKQELQNVIISRMRSHVKDRLMRELFAAQSST